MEPYRTNDAWWPFWCPSDDALGLNFLELPMDWNVGYTLNISKRDAIYLVAILYYYSGECPPPLPQSWYFFRFAFVCLFIQFILQFPLHFSYLINNIYGLTIFPSNFGLLWLNQMLMHCSQPASQLGWSMMRDVLENYRFPTCWKV